MDAFYFFAILGSAAVFLILHFDKQQRRKVNKILHQTSDVEPLLLMQSLGQKLDRLNNALNKTAAPVNIEQQLHKFTSDYKSGRISITTYNKHLSELLRTVEVH
jgi:hypothetical protein